MMIITEINGKTVTIETNNPHCELLITGLDSIVTTVSQAEFEMVQDFRRERETMKQENKISSTEQAVRDIQRLSDYFNCMPNAVINNVYSLAAMAGMNKYQDKAAVTAIYPGKGTALGLIYCALKLSGEAGEVADNVGKALRDDEWVKPAYDNVTLWMDGLNKERTNKIKLELGDVLWYVSQSAKELGFTLEEIAKANLDKLAARKDKGTLKGEGDDR